MPETPPAQPPEYNPNFVFGGNRVISEDNWAEYEAQGVRNLVDAIPEDDDTALRKELSLEGRFYRPGNLLLGDAFDAETGRPLRLKPGIGVYVTAEGREHFRLHFDKSSTRPAPPPVMVLPDGTSVVARPGVRATSSHPQHDKHRDAK